jgi:hypothetical protein
MWHGHRERDQISPPPIPLKIYVFAMGQDAQGTWVNIEVHPGLDDWDVDWANNIEKQGVFMKIKVTVTRNGTTLFSNVYNASVEGDVEKAVSDALTEARRASGGALFDYQINVDKA